MANYYTEFSVLLPHPLDLGVEDANSKVISWFQKTDQYKKALFERALESDLESEWDEWDNRFSSFTMELIKDGDKDMVWLHGDESGNIEAAVILIGNYLEELDFPDNAAVYVSWASYCDKPRINEAIGGGVVVSRTQEHWLSSSSVIDQAKAQGANVLNPS